MLDHTGEYSSLNSFNSLRDWDLHPPVGVAWLFRRRKTSVGRAAMQYSWVSCVGMPAGVVALLIGHVVMIWRPRDAAAEDRPWNDHDTKLTAI